MQYNFEKNGFLIIRNGIIKKNLIDIKKTVNNSNSYTYAEFLKNLKKNKKSFFDYVLPFHKRFLYKDLYAKVLKEPKVLKAIISLLGPDLAHHEDPSLTINISNVNDSKKNYLFKKWHQEIWSGASISTLSFWSPIFLPNNKSGQIEFIQGSHLWGHIPHSNREPKKLPRKYKIIKMKLKEGDVLFFHPLIIHRSASIISNKFAARLSMVTHIKNFKYMDNSFNNNKSWRIFNKSQFTNIERSLGNHYLSPFRLTDDQ